MRSPYIEIVFDGINLKLTVLLSNLHPTVGDCGGIGACNKCKIHHHKIFDDPNPNRGNPHRDEICFSMIPMLECGSTCISTAKRFKEVGFTWYVRILVDGANS